MVAGHKANKENVKKIQNQTKTRQSLHCTYSEIWFVTILENISEEEDTVFWIYKKSLFEG